MLNKMGLLAKCNQRTILFKKLLSQCLQNKPVSKSDVVAKKETQVTSSSAVLKENNNLDVSSNRHEEGKYNISSNIKILNTYTDSLNV